VSGPILQELALGSAMGQHVLDFFADVVRRHLVGVDFGRGPKDLSRSDVRKSLLRSIQDQLSESDFREVRAVVRQFMVEWRSLGREYRPAFAISRSRGYSARPSEVDRVLRHIELGIF